MLLSQRAPLHTLPSFVSSGLTTWPPEIGTGNPSWPKAVISTGQLGVSLQCENTALLESLPGRHDNKILGSLNRQNIRVLEADCQQREGTLPQGSWELAAETSLLSRLFLAGPHNSLLGVRAGAWQKVC